MSVQLFAIQLPEYKFENELDYDAVGKKVDDLLLANLEDGQYIERSIGKGQASNALKAIIKIE
ncbi:MAG: hypothetical protein KJP00_02600 [Bacteroidia bacterium]|nr:hypothetical protein [Bacteroidia bacterium]